MEVANETLRGGRGAGAWGGLCLTGHAVDVLLDNYKQVVSGPALNVYGSKILLKPQKRGRAHATNLCEAQKSLGPERRCQLPLASPQCSNRRNK